MELISDSVLTVIEGLIKALKKIRKAQILFKTELENLERMLQALQPRIEEVKRFDEDTVDWSSSGENLVKVRRGEMDELQEKLKECEQLVRECPKVPRWNVLLVRDYAQRLKDHNEYLRDFVSINMTADAWVVARTTRTVNSIFGSAVPEPPKHTFGWKAPVEELQQKLFQENISVLGIRGLGGCGKTTLAAKFCEQVKGKFYKISFLSISRTPNLLEMVSRLWGDLVSNVGRLPNFLNVDDAMNNLKSRLEKRKPKGMVLVVLDDVWSDPEVEKLVIKEPGFKTLVTTRMDLNWIQHSYKVQPLGMEEAKDLFFQHTHQEHRKRMNLELVEKIVEGCMRLPLALKVIGASLKNAEEWKLQDTATRIAERGQILSDYDQILKCLETSVDSLSEKLRECFTDFCCFPSNKRIRAAAVMDMWVQIRGETELSARRILQDLYDRHLIELFERRRNVGGDPDEGFSDLFVTQHDLLTELADCTSKKTDKTRLVINNQTDELPDDQLTSEAQIVTLDMGDGRRNFHTDVPSFPRAEVLILNFSGSSCSFPPLLKEMEKLKLLIVANRSSTAAELSGLPPSTSLKNLRCVRLEKVSLPLFHVFTEPFPRLQKLSMVLCEVCEVSEEKNSFFDIAKIFPEMTEIELDYCNGLERLPTSVCDIPRLKKLSITNCHDLTELPGAIGRASQLEVLRLRACTSLESLPDSISELKHLKFLSLSECSNIYSLPEAIGGLRSLEKIDARGCSARLHTTVLRLKRLKRVKCDPDTAKMWQPFLAYINPDALVVHQADVSLDFLQ
ncbi:unnamed protein product [Victoria cruziana]